MPRGTFRRALSLGIAAALAGASLAGCGGDLVELNVDGSSTVYPIAELAMIDFVNNGGDRTVDPTVGFVGTGGGGEKFCRGEIQLWTASRPARESDISGGCTAAGVRTMDDLLEFQVGIDALSIVVHPQNDWARCLTVEQLNYAFRDGGAERWSDIDPSWPDQKIIFYYPGTDSGTYDYFVEAVIESFEGTHHRTNGTASEDDNVLALGVEQDHYAIGYFGFAYFQEASESVQAVAIDDGDGCIEPTFENAFSGAYHPLSRPLYMYSSHQILEGSPQAVRFLNFLFNNNDIVREAGYITVPDDVLAEQKRLLGEFENAQP